MNETAVIISMRLGAGCVISIVIGLMAYRRKSLSRSGIAGAVITGTLIFGLGGFACGFLLVMFFVTSSVLSHYKAPRKETVTAQFDKGGQRDLGQALANGGAATVFGVCSGIAALGGAPPEIVMLCLAAVIGALASANADTWATELGVLSRSAPRLITNLGRTVEAGTSGGVTVTGTLAAAAGAFFIGLTNLVLAIIVALLFNSQSTTLFVLFNTQAPATGQSFGLLAGALMGGLSGSLIDSLLGATVQVMYYSERRCKPTERKIERDGTPNRFVRGWIWMNNDWVNFISTLGGAAISALVFSFFIA
jgi:uncharacterized protein (TIGR00297 family)